MTAEARQRNNQRARAWYYKNRAHVIARTNAYRAKNREQIRAADRARIQDNPEYRAKRNAYAKLQYRRNPLKIKNRQRDRRYGLVAGQFDDLFANQLGKCAICKNLMSPPHIDHDHKTGKVRALLCGKCNTGLGQFDECIVRLTAAIEYLSTKRRK